MIRLITRTRLYKNKADTLISEWTADQSGGGYSAVTESTKTKLKNFSASFDKMTQAYESKVASDKEQLEYDALHDTWAKKNAKYGYSVSVKNQGIWYTVNDVNIYDKVAFGAYKQVATATGREPVSLRFRTDQDGKVRSGIGVVKPGDITITVDGSEVEVETKPIGEPPGPEPKMPKPNPNRISPPDKQKILDALSGK